MRFQKTLNGKWINIVSNISELFFFPSLPQFIKFNKLEQISYMKQPSVALGGKFHRNMKEICITKNYKFQWKY